MEQSDYLALRETFTSTSLSTRLRLRSVQVGTS